jgi:hypothetical protein
MGTLEMVDWCEENQNPMPCCKEQACCVILTIEPSQFFEKPQPFLRFSEESRQVTGHVTEQDKILIFCQQRRTAKELMSLLILKHRETFYKFQKYVTSQQF